MDTKLEFSYWEDEIEVEELFIEPIIDDDDDDGSAVGYAILALGVLFLAICICVICVIRKRRSNAKTTGMELSPE